MSLLRRPGKMLIAILANYLANTRIPDLNSGLRITKTKTIHQFLHILSQRYSFTTTMTLTYIKENLDIGYIPIITKPRKGSSKVKFLKDGLGTILLTIRLIMLFDPLRIFLPVSAILFILGMARFVQSLILDIDNTITVILGILGGIIIFVFGLFSDQIAHLRREIKQSKN